jgi:nicotinamidase-related amidase
MENNYTKDHTALLLVDPYNDFLTLGGKFWPMVEAVANQVGLLDNLRTITAAIRKAGIQVFIVPHRRSEPDDLVKPLLYNKDAGKRIGD